MRTLVIVILLIILAGGGYYYYQSQQKAVPATQTTVNTTTTNNSMQAEPTASSNGAMKADTSGAVKEFTVEGKNYSFTPSTITVNKGDKVKITFKNSDGQHDFVLPDFNVKTNIINSGEQVTVEFTADKAGSFQYFCSVANHRTMGMAGTLTVK